MRRPGDLGQALLSGLRGATSVTVLMAGLVRDERLLRTAPQALR